MAQLYRLDRQRPLGLQEFGLSIRLVEASDLPENACGTSRYDVLSGIGEIDVLRSDEYAKLPGGLSNDIDIPRDQLNTVIHEVMHMVLNNDSVCWPNVVNVNRTNMNSFIFHFISQ